jgi:hypothetical protein
MTNALELFWQLVQGAMALQLEVFHLIETLPNGTKVAVYVLLLAGLSQAIAQSLVLFINQVTPIRFILSLGLSAILFVISTGFWVWSIWSVSHVLYGADTAFLTVFRVLGLAYAPLLWSFLIAMPYLGVPVGMVLSIWSLLCFVCGFDLVTGLGRWQALWCALLGWIVFQIMQRTIARPATALSKYLSNSVAGKPLVMNIQGLEKMFQSESSSNTEPQTKDDISNGRGNSG